MQVKSWGNFPKIRNNAINIIEFLKLNYSTRHKNEYIPYGNGRSYGDSALNKTVINMRPYNFFLDFNQKIGELHVQSGVLLSEILDVIVSKGWFFKITPGTKLITIGGAIASDVHGKNHHINGCFSECVMEFNLMLPNGKIVLCSRKKNKELFRATCGGMGLTGIILDCKIRLKRINSMYLNQTIIKNRNLEETFAAFEKYKSTPYSVAWIDCLCKDENIGKSLLMLGEFDNDGDLNYQEKSIINIPFFFPPFLLNKFSIKAFNLFYYNRFTKLISKRKVDINTFFYPLDKIDNWNRIYGKKGFTQYQFILPKEHSFIGLKEILKQISNSGKGSFLAVLKLYGKANKNYLSFPMEGYSLALDFKIEKGIFQLLNKIDEIVLKYKGRIYLSKDVRVSKDTFDKGYPYIDKFRELRINYGMNKKLNSLQSKRLAI